jgi:hypothetical protein
MELKRNLTEAGVEVAFARVPWNMRADFDRHHLMEAIGQSEYSTGSMMRLLRSRSRRCRGTTRQFKRSQTAVFGMLALWATGNAMWSPVTAFHEVAGAETP